MYVYRECHPAGVYTVVVVVCVNSSSSWCVYSSSSSSGVHTYHARDVDRIRMYTEGLRPLLGMYTHTHTHMYVYAHHARDLPSACMDTESVTQMVCTQIMCEM